MKSAYGSIDIPIVSDSQCPQRNVWIKTRFYRLLSAMLVVAVIVAVGFSVKLMPKKSSVVLRSQEFLNLESPPKLATDEDSMRRHFENFVLEYNRTYRGESERASRYGHFKKNLAIIDARNAEDRSFGGLAVYGINMFADYSQEEISRMFMEESNYQEDILKKYPDHISTMEFEVTATKFSDWRSKYVTAVKNQGGCGSCWAFAAVEQIESDTIRLIPGYDRSLNLNTQQIIDCDTYDRGCYGGTDAGAWVYVLNAGGLEFEYDYPYAWLDDTYNPREACRVDSDKFVVVEGWHYIGKESNMINYVLNVGPLTASLNMGLILFYKNGIANCDPKGSYMSDHIVQLVGVNMAASPPYWIVS